MERLRMVDPKLLAWLWEPQLVYRDDKQLSSYNLQVPHPPPLALRRPTSRVPFALCCGTPSSFFFPPFFSFFSIAARACTCATRLRTPVRRYVSVCACLAACASPRAVCACALATDRLETYIRI